MGRGTLRGVPAAFLSRLRKYENYTGYREQEKKLTPGLEIRDRYDDYYFSRTLRLALG